MSLNLDQSTNNEKTTSSNYHSYFETNQQINLKNNCISTDGYSDDQQINQHQKLFYMYNLPSLNNCSTNQEFAMRLNHNFSQHLNQLNSQMNNQINNQIDNQIDNQLNEQLNNQLVPLNSNESICLQSNLNQKANDINSIFDSSNPINSTFETGQDISSSHAYYSIDSRKLENNSINLQDQINLIYSTNVPNTPSTSNYLTQLPPTTTLSTQLVEQTSKLNYSYNDKMYYNHFSNHSTGFAIKEEEIEQILNYESTDCKFSFLTFK